MVISTNLYKEKLLQFIEKNKVLLNEHQDLLEHITEFIEDINDKDSKYKDDKDDKDKIVEFKKINVFEFLYKDIYSNLHKLYQFMEPTAAEKIILDKKNLILKNSHPIKFCETLVDKRYGTPSHYMIASTFEGDAPNFRERYLTKTICNTTCILGYDRRLYVFKSIYNYYPFILNNIHQMWYPIVADHPMHKTKYHLDNSDNLLKLEYYYYHWHCDCPAHYAFD